MKTRIQLRSKANLFWSFLLFAILAYSLFNSSDGFGPPCISIAGIRGTTACFENQPFWFVIFCLVWLGIGIFSLVDAFSIHKVHE